MSPDPGAWARLSEEELEERAREERERRERALEAPEWRSSPKPAPLASSGPVTEQVTRVTARRAVAHLVDGVVLTLVSLLVVGPAAATGSNAAIAIAFLVMFFPGQVAYYVLTQRRAGQSPGKRLARIRVVDRAGRAPGTGELVRRSIPLLVEYFYVVALIAMLMSPYRQRLGDRWAETYVVRA